MTVEPACQKVEDAKQILLLVLIDVVEVDLAEFLDEAQVLIPLAEATFVLDALHVRFLVGEMCRRIAAQLVEQCDNLVEAVDRLIVHHEVIALIRDLKEPRVLLVDLINAGQIVFCKFILHALILPSLKEALINSAIP